MQIVGEKCGHAPPRMEGKRRTEGGGLRTEGRGMELQEWDEVAAADAACAIERETMKRNDVS